MATESVAFSNTESLKWGEPSDHLASGRVRLSGTDCVLRTFSRRAGALLFRAVNLAFRLHENLRSFDQSGVVCNTVVVSLRAYPGSSSTSQPLEWWW